MLHNTFNTLKEFPIKQGIGKFYSIPALADAGFNNINRLPVSIRIVLEAVLRNVDGKRITEEHVRTLANWQPTESRTEEIPFVVARVVLQDFTGVPLLADLAAMRNVAVNQGKNPKAIEPLVPVNLVVDHSVQVDHYNTNTAIQDNMQLEFERNSERYKFMKWGMQAFDTFQVVPPGIGIVHQVNLEYLARGVIKKDQVFYPDTLVGTDSHTTMINGIGVVGWGVGGIEAEAGMLGQPVYFLTPDVVGVNLTGKLKEGVTATDLVLTITEMLRKAKVVGKFVEFFGDGATSLSLPDRATIANMAPEYGATMGFFPVDEETVAYFKNTGRTEEEIDAFVNYWKAQNMFGIPQKGQCDYSQQLELDLSTIEPSVAGPKRPQDRIILKGLKEKINQLLTTTVKEGGYGKEEHSTEKVFHSVNKHIPLKDADVLIAAITSCTNTSNPGVLLAAGILAKKAVQLGLSVNPWVKTSLAPGSRVVTEYLNNAGLQDSLDQLGFKLVGYGCTTCIGNAGPLDGDIEDTIVKNDLVGCAVLSGNRNFEARIHPNIKANFLMSPPLVVAFAIAGRVNIDMTTEPIGHGKNGQPVYLKDIWPTQQEVAEVMRYATDANTYRKLYADFTKDNPLWNNIPSSTGMVYQWEKSTYIAEPPFFKDFSMTSGHIQAIKNARALGIFGDSITTDHISPAGSIKPSSPAGKYLQENGVEIRDFNSYGSRRGNHEVMMRGTFANVRIKNLMIPGSEGGVTVHQPSGEQMAIYDAAMKYQAEKVPTMIFAGEEYGTGSSRDWAAKGTQLLGVKAVIARSFERIHRSNLVGMGVLPCQFIGETTHQSLQLDGSETFDLVGIDDGVKPQQTITLIIRRANGQTQEVPLLLRIDTPIEVDYYKNGGILPYVLRELLN
ncbi:aconitate hydratase AcnA [Ferrovum sp. PN-J185]|uniref:aconitate hydratase AcnA n=1 Tax=Ferrovum sp. PN-J185 TaxID=1356306 RepID=UPI001E5804D3|nr:aconitate hydratase AcnA [Ferrovum sp. PN-J185]MCC6069271.1 aconitate hydratase AcnA [Ferrovum sp. PN-J185]MDE1891429.1 aconitate hydratase AcnA [Betaproteobacteria bacterium]MDE2056045.1 aconitate hydratase AcnA [Betaproteobacteria bacterium]